MDRIVFTEEEILARQKKAQKKMGEMDLEGLLVSAESNINYFADFYSHAPWTTFTRPSFLFIPREGQAILLVQTFLVPEAEATAKACRVMGFDSLLGPEAKALFDIMQGANMASGRIAFELGYEQRMGFEVATFLALKDLLKEAQCVDGSSLLWDLRIIKSEKEIECHRRACQATTYAHDHIFDWARAGMSEFEISQKTQQLMLEGGAEYPGFVIITSGQGNYDRISKTSTNRRLQEGDYLWLDLGARYHGYWSDFCRSGVVGKISDERYRLQSTIREVSQRAAEVMKPGLPVAEVARACARELERVGHKASFDCGRMGHGMGLMSTEPPSVTIHDDTILKEGMIINLEPGLVVESGVFDLEENYVITKDGYETLSGSSHDIHQISL